MCLPAVLEDGIKQHKGNVMKRPWYRPTSQEVDDSIFHCQNKRIYSDNDKRKIDIGISQVKKGRDAGDVCKMLFGSEIKDIVEILLNGTEID